MTRFLTVVVWASVAAVVVGFFLPWAELDFKETALEREVAAAARKSLGRAFKLNAQPAWTRTHSTMGTPLIPTTVSGAQIPMLANRHDVKVMTQLAALASKRSEAHLGLKSLAVYLVPGLALLCGFLFTRAPRRRIVTLGIGIVCAAITITGGWELATTDTRRAFGMAMGSGVWLSLGAYAVLAAAAFVAGTPRLQTRLQRWMPGLADPPPG